MNDVGTFLHLGATLQAVALAVSLLLTLGQKQSAAARVWQDFVLIIGALGAIISLVFPATEILLRVSLSNLSHCLSDPECNRDIEFSLSWIGLSLLAAMLHLATYLYCRRRRIASN